jgi:hypothetical protein
MRNNGIIREKLLHKMMTLVHCILSIYARKSCDKEGEKSMKQCETAFPLMLQTSRIEVEKFFEMTFVAQKKTVAGHSDSSTFRDYMINYLLHGMSSTVLEAEIISLCKY